MHFCPEIFNTIDPSSSQMPLSLYLSFVSRLYCYLLHEVCLYSSSLLQESGLLPHARCLFRFLLNLLSFILVSCTMKQEMNSFPLTCYFPNSDDLILCSLLLKIYWDLQARIIQALWMFFYSPLIVYLTTKSITSKDLSPMRE